MSRRFQRVRRRLSEPLPVTRGVIYGFGASVGITLAVTIGFGTFALLRIADEARDRGSGDRQSRHQVESIARRVVRIERQPGPALIRRLERNLTLCRRFPECAAALDRETQPRRRRRDRRVRHPDQRADRPPRQVVTPKPGPDPVVGPPGPPDATNPSAPSSPASPAPSGTTVDVPPIDVDGDKGLLPNINLPPIDLPPVELPRLLGGE
jgi:hypothetical protein